MTKKALVPGKEVWTTKAGSSVGCYKCTLSLLIRMELAAAETAQVEVEL